jgi:hypothetical protein
MTRALARRFAGPLPYALWLGISASGLGVACALDPYVFGFAAFGAAGVSIALLAIAPWFGTRSLLWALTAALPTLAAFALLSTYRRS